MVMNNNEVIRVQGLKKTFEDDGKTVLNGIDLVVNQGEKPTSINITTTNSEIGSR